MIEPRNSLFVRFRKGAKLVIVPTIFDDTRTFLADVGKTSNIKDSLNILIEHKGGWSGWHVHPKSTWYQVIKDFLSLTEEQASSGTKGVPINIYIELLETIVSEGTPQYIWDKAKKHILDNIETFSSWNINSRIYNLLALEIFLEDGEYYYIKNGEKRKIIGMRTYPEERFEFIKNQLVREYGFLRRIIKMVCLYSLTCDIKSNPTSYPKQICIVLPEREHGNLLGYNWFILGPMPYQIGPWRPQNPFCDIDWLCTDLLSAFALEEGEHIPEAYEQPEYRALLSQKEDPWPDYTFQLDIALEADLQFGDSDDYCFPPFEGRSFRWINGTRDYYPILIAPMKAEEEFEEAFDRIMRFLSILVYCVCQPIRIDWWTGKNVKRLNPYIRASRKLATMGYPKGFAPHVDFALTDKRRLALANFKDAINANNVFYKFLCLWKITSIPFGKDGNNKHMNWINSSIGEGLNYYGFKECVKSLEQNGISDVGRYLKETGRTAIAHVNPTKKTLQINPDEFEDHRRIKELLPLMEALAKSMIKSRYLD